MENTGVVETIPFVREEDALNFVKTELAEGRTVTIWPVNEQDWRFAVQSIDIQD